uniref:NADH dehydrogenase [ubiquinone] 1 alpha subcomplex subunit 11 n=1 Tax=Astyanax mexicanus TaxID=7994 RepID=A0A8B9RK69_ASTMX
MDTSRQAGYASQHVRNIEGEQRGREERGLEWLYKTQGLQPWMDTSRQQLRTWGKKEKKVMTVWLVGSAYHILAFQPDTAAEALTRAANATATMATMGAIFGMATCLSAHARDAPDDPTNYFIGGCAAGAFLGARTHSAMTGTTACLGLGVAAWLTKVGKMEGWRLSGPPKL